MTYSHWFIYALGGGWGHLTRSYALARAAAKQGVDTTIFSNSEYLNQVTESDLGRSEFGGSGRMQLIQLSPDVAVEGVADVAQNLLRSASYDRLIVDTFPRGLTGDLVGIVENLAMPAVLVARDINPEYVAKFDVRKFVNQYYQLVINPGDSAESFSVEPPIVTTAPWLLRDSSELPTKQTMREKLGVAAADQLLVIVCAAGTEAEQAFYSLLAQKLKARFPRVYFKILSPRRPEQLHESDTAWIKHFPGIDFLVAADAVIGSAGYNTICECAAISVPLIVFPQERLYDRQLRRAQAKQRSSEQSIFIVANVDNVDEAEAALSKALATPVKSNARHYVNGTHEAVLEISKLSN